MKKTIAIIAASIILLCGWAYALTHDSNTRNDTFVVVAQYDDETLVQTTDGHVWTVEPDEVRFGTTYLVTFNTNGTEDVSDDVMISYKPFRK